jgi:hypothetical protein
MVAFSGFYESHEPPPSGDARGIVLPHRHGHQNGQQRGGMLLIVVFIVFLAAAGAIRTSSCPLAEFSGFYESPGPP